MATLPIASKRRLSLDALGPMEWGGVQVEFLFYNQKDTNFGEDLVNPITPWAQMMRKREQPTIPVSVYMANQPERLVKQTYSVHVTLPSDSPRGIVRKWHLTAYFSQQRLDDLGTIDNIRGVGDVPVPEGLFKSARAGKMRRDNRNSVKKAVSPSEGPYLPEASGFQSDYCDTASRNSQYYGCPSFPSLFPHPTTSSRFSDNSRDSSPSSDSSRLGPSQHASLVPLEYLQNISAPRRNPADEQQLRRFSSQTTGPSG
ncbi:hypothetical protein H0H92_003948 [Tricholoma furcatifolium]|nr:hypothetical protein H0H92_003948 [Tricholoma furcatifolium]